MMMKAPLAHRVQLILALGIMAWLLLIGLARCAGAAEIVTIKTDHGGLVTEYAERVRRYAREGTIVRIEGTCESSCTQYLGLPAKQVCVMPTAWLGFHGASVPAGTPSPETFRRAGTAVLWSHYPQIVKDKLGVLTSDSKYLRGRDVIPGVRRCD